MIWSRFGLREQPFGGSPDPRFLFGTASHREALASIIYGIRAGVGFTALIAKPGLGKTTLLFEAMRQVRNEITPVFLFETIATPEELLQAVLIDLNVKDVPGSTAALQAVLNEVLTHLNRTGKRAVVCVDEAQQFGPSVLEALRMLSNFETPRSKLVQIILSGQPELANTLASKQLVQFRQRIAIIATLLPLTSQETKQYIEHRLRVAGYESRIPLFEDSALELIAKASGGIPRTINTICFNALSLVCALKRARIDARIVSEVLADLDLERCKEPQSAIANAIDGVQSREGIRMRRPRLWFAMATAACLIALVAGVLARWTGGTFKAPVATKVQTWGALEEMRPSALSIPAPQGDQAFVVTVRKGQSLSQICTGTFGRCPHSLLQRVVELNHDLRNPDYILPGDVIVLPNEVGGVEGAR